MLRLVLSSNGDDHASAILQLADEGLRHLPGCSGDHDGIKSRDWDSYPILQFSGAPEIETVLLNQPNLSFLGSGEASQGPSAAAIANAIYDAVGVRMRDLPLTNEKIMQALIARQDP